MQPLTRWALLAPALCLLAGPAATQDEGAESGASSFKAYCSSCHGKEGRGDGPLASSLRSAPPDLATFAVRTGKWDADAVARIIDGRNPVKGHGGGDMPVWGDAFRGSRGVEGEAEVTARIRALTAYIGDLQEPPLAPPGR